MRPRWVIALVASSLVASPAAADVLCQARSGRIFLRTSCKKHEAAVDLPKGTTGDPGAPAATPVRVVDSAGLPIGLFAEAGHEDDGTGALFEVEGRLLTFGIGRLGFTPGGQLYHLVAHCADDPLVSTPSAALLRRGFVLGTTAYYAGDPIETKTVLSREFFPFSTCGTAEALPNGRCCASTSGELPVGPATVAFEIPSLGLTPPFRLEP